MNTTYTKINDSYFAPSETQREDITAAQKWACGLIDGDGHIGLEWCNKAKTKWVPLLKVSLSTYNARAIYKLKTILKCGKVTTSQNMITLRVRSRAHWQNILLPLWSHFSLRSSKYYDVLCVRQALNIWTDQRLSKTEKQNAILRLKDQLKQNQKTTVPCPVWRSRAGFDVYDQQRLKIILDHDWLAGFIEAEGCFYILSNGAHGFALGQAYNRHIIFAIHKYYSIRAKLKLRSDYIMLDTKNRGTLEYIAKTMQGRFLGMKSVEFALWLRTLRKQISLKSLDARRIIRQMKSMKQKSP